VSASTKAKTSDYTLSEFLPLMSQKIVKHSTTNLANLSILSIFTSLTHVCPKYTTGQHVFTAELYVTHVVWRPQQH